jgi:hypothetical protein
MCLSIRKISNLAAIILGMIFLLSGFLKAMDAAAFSDLMGKYGYDWFGYGAPIIILFEVLLGLTLILRIEVRYTALLTGLFIISVTTIYTYGLLQHDITDCGCFGDFSPSITRTPWILYLRNTILLIVSYVLWKWGDKNAVDTKSVLCAGIVFCSACYLCGFSFRGAKVTTIQSKPKPFEPILVQESPLREIFQPHSDSTYLVFAFSYTCPHCRNSIGNVEQYERMGVVDKVYGFAIEDPDNESKFYQIFQPTFTITNIPLSTMTKITNNLPVVYMIHGDTIVKQMYGDVISASFMVK